MDRPRYSQKNTKNQYSLTGFTVIELLIVIGIIGVIGTVSLANLVGWRSAKELNSASQKIATLIREAESRAMSQDRGSAWGVHFEDSGQGTPFFSLFYSSASGVYSPANEVERYPLPSAIRYATSTGSEFLQGATSTGSEFLQDIVFDQITGKPRKSKIYTRSALSAVNSTQAGGTSIRSRGGAQTVLTYNYVTTPGFTLEIFSHKQNASSSVMIDPNGTIAFDSLNCIFTCYVQQIVLLPPPVILSFSATPTSTTPSQPVTLSWNTVQTDSCTGTPWMNSNATFGSASVTPSQTTTYFLTCVGGGLETTSAVTVEVVPGGGRGRDAPITD